MPTLAHLSDLHFGSHPRVEAAAAALVRSLLAERIDHVVVTGDLTHGGRAAELERFRRAFAPLAAEGRLTVIPGNHDRLGDDVARELMTGRVRTFRGDGLHLVRVDSTGAHNRYVFAGHGELGLRDLDQIDAALDEALPGALVVILLHHHPLPLPEEMPIEKLASWLSLPFAAELDQGRTLCERLRGRCDLVLHGHRHVPSARHLFAADARPLSVFNAGSSTALGRVRVFTHDGGRLTDEPMWLEPGARARRAA